MYVVTTLNLKLKYKCIESLSTLASLESSFIAGEATGEEARVQGTWELTSTGASIAPEGLGSVAVI